jgi:predicted permease
MHSPYYLETLFQDSVYGLRQLIRSPSYTVVTTITLALGIGAASAIFSVTDGVLLRPLPYRDPVRLMWVTERFALSVGPGFVLGPDYVAWRNQNQTFDKLEGFAMQGPTTSLWGTGEPIPVRAAAVTVGFLPMLGLHPIAGRTFFQDDGIEGRDHVLLISERLWQTQFGGSPSALGRTVHLDKTAYSVIGVMPSVEYPEADVWTPVVLNATTFLPQSRPMAALSVIGRLRAGITTSQAASNLLLIAHGIDQEYPPQIVQSRDRHVEVLSLHDVLVRNVRPLLVILLGTVGFVFSIACANVANLSLSRAAVRFREFAIRGALGARRGRLIRQLLTESFLLAATGSALGVFCGVWSMTLLKRLVPRGLRADVELDPRILAFAIGITVLAALLFGLAPALAASRTELVESLKAGGLRTGTGKGTHHLRNALVVCEIALSLVLVISAGLLARSFARLTNVHLGFNPDNVLTAQVTRPLTDGFQTPSPLPFFDEVLRNIRAIPGVMDAAATDRTPLSACAGGAVRAQGATADIQPLCTTAISPGYFRTMGNRFLRGRPFNDHDSSDGPPVVILNETLSRQAFGNRDPIGRQMGVYGLKGISWRTVVGEVADTRNSKLEQRPWPEIFVPYPQALLPLSATFVLRTQGDPLRFAVPVKNAVQAVDGAQSVSTVETLDALIDSSTAPEGFRALLLTLFALLALVLAAVGVFGVMAYSVSQRTHEIGVRIAVGARRGDILALAARQGLLAAGIGLSIGVAGAASLTRLLSAFLYDIEPTDFTTFVSASLLLTATALLACYIPARRAANVDPLVALRNE